MPAQGSGPVNPAGQSSPSLPDVSDKKSSITTKSGVSPQGRRVKAQNSEKRYIPKSPSETPSLKSERSVSSASAKAHLKHKDNSVDEEPFSDDELLYDTKFEVESAETSLVEAEDARFPEETNSERKVNEQALESAKETTEKGGILKTIASAFSGKKGAALGCLMAGFLIMSASVFAAAFPPLGAAVLAVGLCFVGVGTVLLLDACLDPQQPMPQLPGNNGNNGHDGNKGSDGRDGDDGRLTNESEASPKTGGQYHASLRQDDDLPPHNPSNVSEPLVSNDHKTQLPGQHAVSGDDGKYASLPSGRLAVVPVDTSASAGKSQGKFMLMPTGDGRVPNDDYQRQTRDQMHKLVGDIVPAMGLENNVALQQATEQMHGQLMLQPEKSANPADLATPQMVNTLRNALPVDPEQNHQISSENHHILKSQLAELNTLIGQLTMQAGQQDQKKTTPILNDAERGAGVESGANQVVNEAELKASLEDLQRLLREQLSALKAKQTSLETDAQKPE